MPDRRGLNKFLADCAACWPELLSACEASFSSQWDSAYLEGWTGCFLTEPLVNQLHAVIVKVRGTPGVTVEELAVELCEEFFVLESKEEQSQW